MRIGFLQCILFIVIVINILVTFSLFLYIQLVFFPLMSKFFFRISNLVKNLECELWLFPFVVDFQMNILRRDHSI